MTPTKDELIKRANKYTRRGATVAIERDTVVDMIDIMDGLVQALDAQIKACDVPKIEGLDTLEEDIGMIDYMLEPEKLKQKFADAYQRVIKAARAFHKMTGGE